MVADWVGKNLYKSSFAKAIVNGDATVGNAFVRAIDKLRLALGNKKSRSHTNLAVVERLFMRALENEVQTREGVGELHYAILETVKKAVQNKGDIGETYNQKKLSPVPDEVAEMVLKASDGAIDISNKTIAVNGDDIYHAHRRHSDEQKETSRNQIAISENDIAEMIEAIYAPDVVECLFDDTDNPTQKQGFAYAKKKDGYYVVAEAVGGKRNPNIVPAMMIYVTEAKWNQFVGAGKTIGEMIYENDFDKLSALDVQKNKKNRVIAAQFVLNKTIANTPRSPRSNTNVSQNTPGVNTQSMQNAPKNSSSGQLSFLPPEMAESGKPDVYQEDGEREAYLTEEGRDTSSVTAGAAPPSPQGEGYNGAIDENGEPDEDALNRMVEERKRTKAEAAAR